MLLNITENDLKMDFEIKFKGHQTKILQSIENLKKEIASTIKKKSSTMITTTGDLDPNLGDLLKNSTLLIRLKCVDGFSIGNEFILTDTCNIIGKLSDPNIVTIKDDFMSQKHCQLTTDNNTIYIQDLGSSNGTFIKLTGETEIFVDSFIKIGYSEFKVVSLTKESALLKAVEGDDEGKTMIINPKILKEPFTIGRGFGSTWLIASDEEMSGLHATFTLNPEGKLYVKDNGSTNG